MPIRSAFAAPFQDEVCGAHAGKLGRVFPDTSGAELKAAANSGDYSYYHLLSGADLPLRPRRKSGGFEQRERNYPFFRPMIFAMEERTQGSGQGISFAAGKGGQTDRMAVLWRSAAFVKMQKLLPLTGRNGMGEAVLWFAVVQHYGALAKVRFGPKEWIKSTFFLWLLQ